MDESRVTDADIVVLGFLAEQPRHGYDLDAVIQQRGIRVWTSLAFSSIYYVLNRLESRGWVFRRYIRRPLGLVPSRSLKTHPRDSRRLRT